MNAIQTIRCRVDIGSGDNFLDLATGTTPKWFRATDLILQFGFFQRGEIADMAAITSMTFKLMALTKTGNALMLKTVSSFDNTLTSANWDDGSKQHAIFTFLNAETALDLGGTQSVNFWIFLLGLIDDSPVKQIILGFSVASVMEGGIAATPTPPLGDPAYFTALESDDRYVRLNNNILPIKHAVTGVQWGIRMLGDGSEGNPYRLEPTTI